MPNSVTEAATKNTQKIKEKISGYGETVKSEFTKMYDNRGEIGNEIGKKFEKLKKNIFAKSNDDTNSVKSNKPVQQQ